MDLVSLRLWPVDVLVHDPISLQLATACIICQPKFWHPRLQRHHERCSHDNFFITIKLIQYDDHYCVIFNYVVAALFPALYVVLCVVLVVRTKGASSSNVTVSKIQKQVSQIIFKSLSPNSGSRIWFRGDQVKTKMLFF